MARPTRCREDGSHALRQRPKRAEPRSVNRIGYAAMEWMAGEVRCGRYLHCPEGSHLCQYDDPGHFFPGLVNFLLDVDRDAPLSV